MVDVVFLIPSYRRSEKQPTLDYLRGMGYGKESIVVSTQTEDDYRRYSDNYGEKAQVIYRAGNCVGDNRNTLLDYAQEKGWKMAVMLDDDIRCLTRLVKSGERRKGGKSKDVVTRQDFERIIENCFLIAKKYNVPLFGVYPFVNPLYQSFKVDVKNIFVGTFMGIADLSLRFNPSFIVKEDYELCLRLISRGYRCFRFRSLSVKAGHKTSGGCEGEWNSGQSAVMTNRLLFMYPDFVKETPKRKGEIILKR